MGELIVTGTGLESAVPSIIKSYARGGGSMVFLLDIEPSVVDTWLTKRYATSKVTVDGEAYDSPILGGLSRIGFEAKVIQGGNVMTFPDIDVKLINKERLHEQFVTDTIEGRRAVIKMTAIGPNVCLNSSFEAGSMGEFDNWTRHPSGLGGDVEVELGTFYDCDTACKITSTNGTAGSYITSDPMTWRIGSKLILSVYAKAASGTATLRAAVHVGNNLWYNATAKTFGVSRVANTIGVANATEWQRFSLEMDWKNWIDAVSGASLELVDQPVFIELWCSPNQSIIIDAVQVELNTRLTPYNHNRYELTADDAFTVFTGIVKNPEWSADQISISLEAWESNKHRDIPKALLTNATDPTWLIPKDSLGKPFPMTYGDFDADELTVWDSNNVNLSEFARGLLANINPTATGGILIYFDRPGMKLYAGGTLWKRLYHFNEDNSRYYEQMYNDKTGYAYATREFITDFASHPRWKSNTSTYWLPLGKAPFMAFLKAQANHNSAVQWLTPENACDGVLSTNSYRYDSGIEELALSLEQFPFDTDYVIKFGDTDAWMYLLGDFAAAGTGKEYLQVYLQGINGWDWGCPVNSIWYFEDVPLSWRNTPIKRVGGDPAQDKKLTEVRFEPTSWTSFKSIFSQLVIAVETMGSSSTAISKVYETGALIYFTLPFEDFRPAGQLFGRTFGTTWDGRKTAVDMVESAPEVIESIIREELDAADADIDGTMFDAVDAARPETAAGQVLKTKYSLDVVKDICDEFGLLYYIDMLGRHSLINLDWRPVTKHLFLRSWYDPFKSVKISYTPRADIVNDITLHYDKNQYTGEYRKVAFCNKDDSSGSIGAAYEAKCAESYAELGNKVQAIELECNWIKATATAEAMVKWHIDWLYKQRLMISGDLFLDSLDLQLGDIVDVDLDPLLPKSFTMAARFMVISLNINRSNSRLTVKLLEVKEP